MHAAFVIPQTWRDDIHNQRINRYLQQARISRAKLFFFFSKFRLALLIRYRRPGQLFFALALAHASIALAAAAAVQ